eukprot:scaffold204265_cov27-Tisochrysis_lutea.AAC.4
MSTLICLSASQLEPSLLEVVQSLGGSQPTLPLLAGGAGGHRQLSPHGSPGLPETSWRLDTLSRVCHLDVAPQRRAKAG